MMPRLRLAMLAALSLLLAACVGAPAVPVPPVPAPATRAAAPARDAPAAAAIGADSGRFYAAQMPPFACNVYEAGVIAGFSAKLAAHPVVYGKVSAPTLGPDGDAVACEAERFTLEFRKRRAA